MNAPHSQSSPGDLMGPAYFRMVEQIGLDDDAREAAQKTVQGVIGAVDKHHAAAVAVKSDSDLSEAGRQSRLKALVERHDQMIDTLTQHPLETLQERAQQLRSTIDNASTTAPTHSDVLLQIEARRHLENMDPLMRSVLVKRLAEDGSDDRTLDAALNASSAAPLIDNATAGHLRAVKAARLMPDISGKLSKLLETHGVLTNTISAARHAIATPVQRNHLGVADSISRAAMALGAKLSVPASQAPQA